MPVLQLGFGKNDRTTTQGSSCLAAGLEDATPLALRHSTPCIPGKIEGWWSWRAAFCFLAGEPGAAFVGEPVFLEAAGGFVGDGGFNKPARQGHIYIIFAQMSAIGETQQLANLGVAQFTRSAIASNSLPTGGVTGGVTWASWASTCGADRPRVWINCPPSWRNSGAGKPTCWQRAITYRFLSSSWGSGGVAHFRHDPAGRSHEPFGSWPFWRAMSGLSGLCRVCL